MSTRQYILPVILSFVAGGLSGAGASRIVTEHRLSVLETTMVHVAKDVQWIRDFLVREHMENK